MPQKTFLSYDEQLNLLQVEKHLIITNSKYARAALEKIGYYALISGYKNLFKHNASNKYLRGVTFEEIVSFYYFDAELRTLFLKYILHIERHIKSLISYYFCEQYGEDQSAYLNINNYTLTKKNSSDVKRLLFSLKKTVSLPSHYKYINHYANKHGNIPLWVAMNAITFGQISKFFQYIPNNVQTKISKNFEHMTERQLHQFIRVIASCRNVCAHGERLYSFRVNETIPNTLLHEKLKIPKKNNQFIFGKQDLFAIVISLRYLMSNEDFKIFKAKLTRIINQVLKQCPHLSQSRLLNDIGFPINWNKITLYKK